MAPPEFKCRQEPHLIPQNGRNIRQWTLVSCSIWYKSHDMLCDYFAVRSNKFSLKFNWQGILYFRNTRNTITNFTIIFVLKEWRVKRKILVGGNLIFLLRESYNSIIRTSVLCGVFLYPWFHIIMYSMNVEKMKKQIAKCSLETVMVFLTH